MDTHAFLWFVLNDPQLSRGALSSMADPDNDLLFSPASYWEMAIKISWGKYGLPGDESFEDFVLRQIDENDLTILPITVSHAAAVSRLPFHHRDPFDRLLIAQSIVEEIPILSADKVLDHYGVTRTW